MPASADSNYRPGRCVLEKYELVRPLAEGGMGVVWIARHRTLELDVAIKLTTADGSEPSRSCQQRALSEARLAARLAHPAVCRVLDFGLTAEGDPCVVTELLRGEALDQTLARDGRLPPVHAVQIILPILDALGAAHEHGIVHRDVKPSNIFLARDAQNRVQPKLMDFGIARAGNQQASWALTGTISGTPCYMSPEQATAKDDVDQRTDLWSVCATLYELLSGSTPFDGSTCTSLLSQVVLAEPRPLSEQGIDDPSLEAIVARGLQKSLDRRWSSAPELAAELARWLLLQGVETDVSGHALRARLGNGEARLANRESDAGVSSDAVAFDLTLPSAPVAPSSRAALSNHARTSRAFGYVPRRIAAALAVGLLGITAVGFWLAPSRSSAARPGSKAAGSEVAAQLVPGAPADARRPVAPVPASTLAIDINALRPSAQRIASALTEAPSNAAVPKATVAGVATARARVAPRPSNDLGYDFGF
jgi:eukaryotic-like serine/threonine-protein kinase